VNDDSIDYVIVTGDFNDNQLDVNNVNMRNISMQYNLQQLVEDPTNFTEHSSSLIDLILTNDVNFVPFAGVGPPLVSPSLYNQILRLNDLLTGLGAFKNPMTGQW
jgi:hypothetical protein